MDTVRDIVSGQALETIRPDELVMEALRRMEFKRISALLVFNGNKFVGIVTMTDIAHSGHGQDGSEVRSIMTPAEKVITVTYDDSPEDCSNIMRDRHIHHLVVKDEKGNVVGIVSSLDV